MYNTVNYGCSEHEGDKASLCSIVIAVRAGCMYDCKVSTPQQKSSPLRAMAHIFKTVYYDNITGV